ncbi:MAG TPA: MGMT family protein [Solirubrobacteraceae bacterium]|nr:MGMT family protein [Solirubrobacteraceae bacterium]
MALTTETILDRVRRVPPGFVTTYGDLSPGAPRQAGRVLAGAGDVPWWRVVRADGGITQGTAQRERLLSEGVPMRGDRVLLDEARIAPEAIR